MNRFDEEQRQTSAAGLVGLAIGLGLGAVILYAIDGPPRLPDQLPSWDVVLLTLQGSSVPYSALVYLLVTAAWAIWAWVVASLVLRLIVVSFDVMLHGAGWIRPLRSISDRMTLPVVRRLVDGAVVAILLVNLTARSPSIAAAAPLTSEVMVVVAESPAKTTSYVDSRGEPRDQERRTIQYTVQPGDTLWGIAERFYGTGGEYPRLVEANLSRQMMDGRVFTQAGVILPGWVLLVPMPSATVEEVDGNRYYGVEAGDSLSGIAARLLGAETRWPEIFELNRGVARLEDGRVLQDPELIWPGLRLRLPLLADEDAEATQTAVPAGDIAASIGSPVEEPSGLPTPAMTAVPAVAIEREPVSTDEPASPVLAAAAAIAAAAAAGGAAFAIRRRGRRSLGEPPIRSEPLPRHDDFAEAETARVLTHQMHGEAEPVMVVAEQAMRFLADHGVRDLSLIAACQGRSATALTFSGGLEAQGDILELGEEFASRLGGKGLASLTADHDVLLQVGGVNRAGLLALSVDQRADSPWLLPLGVFASNETLYANWRELGNVLIAGLPGGGSDVILTSVISGLAARRGPEELALYAVSSRRNLPAQVKLFPHLKYIVASDDEDQANEMLDHVRDKLIQRMQADAEDLETGSGRQEVVLVISELAELKDAGATLELIGEHGPSYGVRLLAASTNPTTLDEGLLAHFGSRIVLQTLDDEESIHLLGQPNAADLGSGDILVRIDGRTPMQARGFRVSTEHLDGLLRLMQEAYGRRLSQQQARDDMAVGEALSPQREPLHEMNPEATNGEPLTDESHRPTSPYDDELGPAGGDGQEPPNGEVSERKPDQNDHPSRPPEDDEALVANMAFGARPQTVLAHRPLAETVGLGLPAARAHDSRSNGHQTEFVELALPAQAPAAGGKTWDVAAPVQVRCFGGLEVRSADREITPTLEDRISFKSFELLAFLAVHPDGAVSKDKLLAALWPESDEERGGKSMGVAMVRLRALLSRQVPGLSSKAVRCERDGVCRVDSGLIWSDVQEFLSRCRAAPKLPDDQAIMALQRALALYRGDLLAGPGSRRYEWVDERDDSAVSLRETYREEYNRASLRLARLFCRDGEAAQAVPILKNLLKAEPTLEDVVRDLYRCYRRIGDLSSLIREERHLRQALQETYYDPEDPDDDPKQYQPEPETVELFEQIRAELESPGGPNQEIAGMSG